MAGATAPAAFLALVLQRLRRFRIEPRGGPIRVAIHAGRCHVTLTAGTAQAPRSPTVRAPCVQAAPYLGIATPRLGASHANAGSHDASRVLLPTSATRPRNSPADR